MSGSSYCPMSAVYVQCTAPLSRIQATATEVSRPPEKAIPTRSPAGNEVRTLDKATIICTPLHVYTIASALPRGSSRGRVAPMAPETCPQCPTPRESADFAFCTNCGAPFAAGGTQTPVEEAGTQVLPQQPDRKSVV